MCVFLKLNAKEKAVCWFCGCEEDDDVELVWAARVWRGILDCILLLLFFFFFSNICDYIKEGPVLLLLFPSLSLSPLIGPLKHGVCVCCFVLFVLSGCYVVMLCVKKKKKLITKKLILLFSKDALNWPKLMTKTFIMLRKISISDKCCSSELSIHQRNLKKNLLSCFQHNNNKCFLSSKSEY